MATTILVPMDYHSINVEPGDLVCLGPVKPFYKDFYWGFILTYGEARELFEVVDTYPMINATEINLDGERMMICNDMLVRFHWH